MLRDAGFLAALERCTLPPTKFGHRAHVRAGYLYLRELGLPQALERLCTVLQRYATSLGQSERYPETMTVAYLALINERLRHRGDGEGWEGFAQSHPDLFKREALLAYYSPQVLDSTRARHMFLLSSHCTTRSA